MNATGPVVHTSTSCRPDVRAGVVSVLIAMAEHLDLHDLPIGYGVEVLESGQAEIGLHSDAANTLAAQMIAWADTLGTVTAYAAHVQKCGWVLLKMTGQLPAGVSVNVFGSTGYAEYLRAAHTEIEPNHRVPLPVDDLRVIATTAQAGA